MVSASRFRMLIQELKRRRVFRVATLYVVSMWPIIQIADILSPALNLPDDAMRNLLLLFIVGFPIAITLAWVFNLTPGGLVKNSEDDTESSGRLIGKKVELAVIVFFVITAVTLFSIRDMWQEGPVPSVKPQQLTASASVNSIESIAVLPFVPFSEDKQDEFFADGLAEELLNVLAKIKSLRVAARTSSFAYKGIKRNIQKIGRELDVDVILEGSVRRNDINNTVRVTAQLIEVSSGTHLWSETYDRKFQDIFKIQDEITNAVVTELKITLLGNEKQQLLAHETADPEAMAIHSQGRTELAKRTSASVELAGEYFQQAVARDPNYPTAYASLAEAYVLMTLYSGKPKKEYIQLAQESVNKALEIDEQLGLAWAAQGLIYFSDYDKMDEARSALKKAIELNPSYAMAYMWYGSLQDDVDKKIELHKKAFQLDPRSPVAGFNVAINLVDKGKDKEAMEVFTKIVDADPFYPGAYQLVAIINELNGRVDQAIINYRKSYDLGASSSMALSLAGLYVNLGEFDQAEKWLAIASENAEEKTYSGIEWIEVALLLGKKDFEQLERKLTVFTKKPAKDLMQAISQTSASYVRGDYPATIASFEKAKGFVSDWQKDLFESGKWKDTLIQVSYAYQQLEKIEESKFIIEQIKKSQQKMTENGFRIKPSDWYSQSLIDAIEGNSELAIVSLQRAVDQGWAQSWRIHNEHILKPIMEKPAFKEVLQSFYTRISIMKEQLAFEQKFTAL